MKLEALVSLLLLFYSNI